MTEAVVHPPMTRERYGELAREGFASMTLEDALGSDLWPMVDISHERDASGLLIKVGFGVDTEVTIPPEAVPEDLGIVALGEYVRLKLQVDFDELAKVIEYKVDFTLCAA